MDRSVIAEKSNPDLSQTATGPDSTLPGSMVQFFVFEHEDYLGWDCFDKSHVCIGKGPEADLVLDHPLLNGIQALVQIDGQRILIQDPRESGQLRVNDEVVHSCELGSLDVVRIGPYTLKIRVKPQKRKVTHLQSINGSGKNHKQVCEDPNPASLQQSPFPSVNDPSALNESPQQLSINPIDALKAQKPEPLPKAPAQKKGSITAKSSNSLGKSLKSWRPWEKDGKFTYPAEKTDSQEMLTQEIRGSAETPLAEEQISKTQQAASTIAAANPQPQTANDPEILACLQILEDGISDQPAPPLHAKPATEAEIALDPPVDKPKPNPLDQQPTEDSSPEEQPDHQAATQAIESSPFFPFHNDESWDSDDEEEEPDYDATFSLREKLLTGSNIDAPGEKRANVLQVIRLRNDQVLDIRYLEQKEKYLVPGHKGSRCLVENSGSKGCFLYVDSEQYIGRIDSGDQPPRQGKQLCTTANRASRHSNIHRVPVPQRGQASIVHGLDEYIIGRTALRPSPEVAITRPAKGRVLRTLLGSSFFHLIILLLAGMFISLPGNEPTEPPESRFVQIDTKLLEPLMTKPPAPKTVEKKIAKVEPAKEKPRVKPVTKTKPKQTKLASKPKPASQKVAKSSPKAAPDAGGGHKGNALNRNIKKEGLLGALGVPDGIQAGAKEALAAVTNIAAVSTSYASEGKLSVGAISGKLGSSKIELPSVGLVSTKGSAEVVASAGVSGKGGVAALEKGNTGQNQVMAMVSADLKAPVNIQGGMSREEVKKVIDQHMDEISYCYETALIEDPSILGKMTFEWRILKAGNVGAVRIASSSIRSDALHSCIKRSIKSWQFPEPRGADEVVVSYPFIFDVVGF